LEPSYGKPLGAKRKTPQADPVACFCSSVILDGSCRRIMVRRERTGAAEHTFRQFLSEEGGLREPPDSGIIGPIEQPIRKTFPAEERRMTVLRRVSLVGFALLLLASPLRAETVSFESLLDEMIQRDHLARWPQPAYTCRQASSYDRDTVAPDKPGWFANWDRSQFVRTEEKDGHKEYVLMDEKGPGAVVRFWATWHGPGGGKFSNGTLRVYLDGATEPTIEGHAEDVIDRGALTGPPLSQGVSPETEYDHRGHNLYLPIPYAKQCKITYETDVLVDQGAKKGEALYYQINYRTYDSDTDVQTFALDDLEDQKRKLQQVQQRLAASGASDAGAGELLSEMGQLAAGATESRVLQGPAAITKLTLKIQADDLSQALRSTILSMQFDGEQTVWCPIGAFFGTGYKIRPYKSWYTEVKDDGTMTVYWVMPFAESCELKLMNLMDQPVDVQLAEARVEPWEWDDRSLHFHSTWRQLTKVNTKGGKDMTGEGAFDVNYVTVDGRGVYAGDTLVVFNGINGWWGEGDEKIWVDNESFPSHVGTGTEDYYGYAWCKPAYFSAPFHAQPDGSGNLNVGFSVNSRYRSLDAIPFQEKIQFDMELWHWAETNMNYAPATFWYARPGATCSVQPDPDTAAKKVAMQRTDVVDVFIAEGALEGEKLKKVELTGGTFEIQTGPFRWSDDRQIWWREGKVGDRLVLEFPVDRAGSYRVVANLTKAIDYGIVKIAINDNQPIQVDRFFPSVDNDEIDLGTFDLKQGVNRLKVEIVGANENAIKRYMFGLDYLKLIAQP
jgi:hypothetical protein